MIEHRFQIDDADRVWLMGAMCTANELEGSVPEGEVSRLGAVEVGWFFGAAQFALDHVLAYHRQTPENWDGVVWYEMLNDASPGSLADRLVALVQRLDRAPTSREVCAEVMLWLTEYGI